MALYLSNARDTDDPNAAARAIVTWVVVSIVCWTLAIYGPQAAGVEVLALALFLAVLKAPAKWWRL